MYNFCTLFDSNYLTRGLVMYESLKKHCEKFHLYIFAFDEKAHRILTELNYENITVISLQEFENERLLSVKSQRSRAEYCWTCTSSTILHIFNHYNVENCTYIDADLFFYSSPVVLFDEMKENSSLITLHRYTKKYDRSEIAGKYCVQFITFKNNKDGLKTLNWWVDSCIEWCYDRYEDGKFGDQKYLDNWTSQFDGIHVLEHLGGGLAPWNIQQYELSNMNDGKPIFKEKSSNKTFEGVFYHFHYVRFYSGNLVDLGWFSLDKAIVKNIYAPYINELKKAADTVKKLHPDFRESLRPFSIKDTEGLKNKLKILVKLITRYNLFNSNQL